MNSLTALSVPWQSASAPVGACLFNTWLFVLCGAPVCTLTFMALLLSKLAWNSRLRSSVREHLMSEERIQFVQRQEEVRSLVPHRNFSTVLRPTVRLKRNRAGLRSSAYQKPFFLTATGPNSNGATEPSSASGIGQSTISLI